MIHKSTASITMRPMKFRTQIYFFAILPAILFSAFAPAAQAQNNNSSQTLTATFQLPAATSPPVVGAAVEVDDASSGLADERLRASANAPVFSITDAIALTLQQNPQRAAAWAAVEAARERIGTAKSAGGPQVNISGNAETQRAFGFPSVAGSNIGSGSGGTGTGGTGSGGSGTGSTGGGNFGGGSSSNGGFTNSQSVSLNATLPIYTGGRVKAGKRVAEYSAQAQ